MQLCNFKILATLFIFPPKPPKTQTNKRVKLKKNGQSLSQDILQLTVIILYLTCKLWWIVVQVVIVYGILARFGWLWMHIFHITWYLYLLDFYSVPFRWSCWILYLAPPPPTLWCKRLDQVVWRYALLRSIEYRWRAGHNNWQLSSTNAGYHNLLYSSSGYIV